METTDLHKRFVGGVALGTALLGALVFHGRVTRWVIAEVGISARHGSDARRRVTASDPASHPPDALSSKPGSVALAEVEPFGNSVAVATPKPNAAVSDDAVAATARSKEETSGSPPAGVHPRATEALPLTRSSTPADDWGGYRPVVLTDNPSIRRYVTHFSRDPKGKRTFQQWLDRASNYAGMIYEQLDRAGLPRDLLAVAMIESGLDPLAVSPAGATGMWQFIEETARLYGLGLTDEVDQRRAPLLATQAAARYLLDLYNKFRDWPLALAGYNAGESRIQQLMQDTASQDFWSLSARSAELPEETVQYVPKVLAVMTILRDVQTYGFTPVTNELASNLGTVVAAPATSLELLARALAMPIEELRHLNPELTGNSVPALKGANTLQVPASRAELAAFVSRDDGADADSDTLRKLARVVVPSFALQDAHCFPVHCRGTRDSPGWQGVQVALNAASLRLYRVRPGDSLEKLAASFQVDSRLLMSENGVSDPHALRVGQTLRVPSSQTTL